MTRVVGVQGTWERRGGWWQDGSPLWVYLADYGIAPVRVNGHAFEWETGLGSSVFFWRRWGWSLVEGRDVSTWRYAGYHLRDYMDALPYEECNVIAYSHGANPVFFAAASGARIRRLITFGSPVRDDMKTIRELARMRIARWCHVCDERTDWTAIWGMFGDGRIGGDAYIPSESDLTNWRLMPEADVNVRVPGIGHGGLLTNPALFSQWQRQGLAAFLRGEGYANAA